MEYRPIAQLSHRRIPADVREAIETLDPDGGPPAQGTTRALGGGGEWN